MDLGRHDEITKHIVVPSLFSMVRRTQNAGSNEVERAREREIERERPLGEDCCSSMYLIYEKKIPCGGRERKGGIVC